MTDALGTVVARLRAGGCVRAEEEAALLLGAADDATTLEDLVARRVAGEPLEHLVGWAELAGRRVVVGPGVFVPRRRSELLVREAVRRGLAEERPGTTVLDLCCGSGALGLAVTLDLREAGRDVVLHAADLDPRAVACARLNLAALGGTVHEGDLWSALPEDLRGSVDLLLAHVPYVPTTALPLLPTEAREHEPALALDGGTDGLDLLRRVARDAAHWLSPGGTVLLEVGVRQVPRALAALTAGHLRARPVEGEDGELVVVGTRRR